jgi:hypothetical protein
MSELITANIWPIIKRNVGSRSSADVTKQTFMSICDATMLTMC